MNKVTDKASKLTSKISNLAGKIRKKPSKTENTDDSSKKDTTRDGRSRQNRSKIIIVAIIVLAIILFFVFKAVFNSEGAMKNQLENYAREIYEKQLKDRDSDSYTLNLAYIERQGYNVSSYTDKNCDKTGTYAIVSVNKDKEVIGVTTQLKCNESQPE